MTENNNKNAFYTRGCSKPPSLIQKNNDIYCKNCSKLNSYNWLKEYDIAENNEGEDQYFEVRFKNSRKEFYTAAAGIKLHEGDIVAVESNPGHDIGIISLSGNIVKLQIARKNYNKPLHEYLKIYRKARLSDIEKWINAVSKEDETLVKSRKIISELNLNMKLNDVEYQGDDTRAIFYYSAEDRVDFRELIKLLAENFKVRIEMKQIGARQEAARLGGIGPCGREICCSSWQCKFATVSTNAAREQHLSLNPQKLAGQCSKLKCCINYEYDSYCEAGTEFPKQDIVLKTKLGEASPQKVDIFGRIIWYSYNNNPNAFIPLPLETVYEIQKLNLAGETVEKLENFIENNNESSENKSNQFLHDDINRFDRKIPKSKNRNDKTETKE